MVIVVHAAQMNFWSFWIFLKALFEQCVSERFNGRSFVIVRILGEPS